MKRPFMPSLRLVTCLVVLAYFAAGKFGLMLAFVNASASAVWPPTGIALASLLLFGYDIWPGIFLGAFLVNATTAGSLATSLGIALGNTLEAVAGAWLVNRFANGRRAFRRTPDVFRFAVLAGLVSTTISPTIGTTSLALGGFALWDRYGPIWWTWWLGDMTGALIVTPLLLLWTMEHPRWSFRKTAEFVVALLALCLTGQVVFGGMSPPPIRNYPLEFLCIPPLVWVAFRFSPREAAAAIVVLSSLAISGTLRGFGPFAAASQNASLLLLQSFMGVTALGILVLAIVVSELREAHDELEQRVEERTASLRASHEELKAAHLRLIQAAKLESIGRLAAGVAHEVKNPLAVILQGVDYLSKRLSAEDGNATLVLKYTRDAVRRADAVIRGLLDFATTKELVMTEEPLNEVLDAALQLVKHELDRAHVTVEKAFEPSLPTVRLDRNKIEQVFVNIFMNAIQAMPAGGALTVRTSAVPKAQVEDAMGNGAHGSRNAGEVVVTEVEDTGSGISEEHLQKVFDPFFTTKPTGQGTGLGLTVTKKIVELHQGMLAVRNRPEGGVRVTVFLSAGGDGHHGKDAHPARG